MSLYLEWYVKHVEQEKNGRTAFLVVSIKNTAARFTVYRKGTEWHCPCDTTEGVAGTTVWIEGPIAGACTHICRAYFYYRNMLKHAEDMKQQVKTMAEASKQTKKAAVSPSTPLLETKKRKITLKD